MIGSVPHLCAKSSVCVGGGGQEISQLPHFTTAAIHGHINTFISVNNCVTLLKVFHIFDR